jgi:hypothetical protein
MTEKKVTAPKAQKKTPPPQIEVTGTVHHVWDKQPARIHIKVERNSKGYNWEVSFEGEDTDEVLTAVMGADAKLSLAYAEPVVAR